MQAAAAAVHPRPAADTAHDLPPLSFNALAFMHLYYPAVHLIRLSNNKLTHAASYSNQPTSRARITQPIHVSLYKLCYWENPFAFFSCQKGVRAIFLKSDARPTAMCICYTCWYNKLCFSPRRWMGFAGSSLWGEPPTMNYYYHRVAVWILLYTPMCLRIFNADCFQNTAAAWAINLKKRCISGRWNKCTQECWIFTKHPPLTATSILINHDTRKIKMYRVGAPAN